MWWAWWGGSIRCCVQISPANRKWMSPSYPPNPSKSAAVNRIDGSQGITTLKPIDPV